MLIVAHVTNKCTDLCFCPFNRSWWRQALPGAWVRQVCPVVYQILCQTLANGVRYIPIDESIASIVRQQWRSPGIEFSDSERLDAGRKSTCFCKFFLLDNNTMIAFCALRLLSGAAHLEVEHSWSASEEARFLKRLGRLKIMPSTELGVGSLLLSHPVAAIDNLDRAVVLIVREDEKGFLVLP